MTNKGRIYCVTRPTKAGEEFVALVRAHNQHQALGHVVRRTFAVRSASQEDMLAYLHAGGVLNATRDGQLDITTSEDNADG